MGVTYLTYDRQMITLVSGIPAVKRLHSVGAGPGDPRFNTASWLLKNGATRISTTGSISINCTNFLDSLSNTLIISIIFISRIIEKFVDSLFNLF